MKTLKQFIIIFSIAALSSCGGDSSRYSDENAKAEAAPYADSTFISSSAAVESGADTTRKFIRTADLKFKVNDVIQSTYDIENITTRFGGFVTYTHLASNVNAVTVTPVRADSSLESTSFEVVNTITLRIPNTQLDTTLKEISHNIEFLDFRTIKADNVALQILANKLIQKRAAKNERRLTLAIDGKGRKLHETTDAEELLMSRGEQGDNAILSNLSLADQINFSTVTLAIYQRPTVKRELISNGKNIEAFQPGFGSKIGESFQIGWTGVTEFIVALVTLWPLIAPTVLVYFLYRKFGHKFIKKS
jgi:Domain of unknown function (DUF4349)